MPCNDQALRDPDLLCTEFGPSEYPVFATKRDVPQGPLKVVRIDCDIRASVS